MSTVGASGDYSTIQDCIDLTGDGVCEIIDAADFDEELTVDRDVKVTVASAARHDGTPGSGARLRRISAPVNGKLVNISGVTGKLFEYLEIDVNGKSYEDVVYVNSTPNVHRNIIHGLNSTEGYDGAAIFKNSTGNCYIGRNIIYDIARGNSYRSVAGIKQLSGGSRAIEACNNTVDDIRGASGGIGVFVDYENSNEVFKNNAVTNTDNECYLSDSGGWTFTSNASDDLTGNITGISAATEYEDATNRNYLLASGAVDLPDAGADLGTTGGFNIDILGRDVDAQGDTWDIGAHEFVSGGGATTKSPVKGALELKGYASTLRAHKTKAAVTSALRIGGYTPAIQATKAKAPVSGLLLFRGYPPAETAITGATKAALTGMLKLRGYAPTEQATKTKSPAQSTLLLKGYPPAESVEAGTVTKALEKGTFIFRGYAAAVSAFKTKGPQVGVLQFKGYAPSTFSLATVSPVAGTLNLKGYPLTKSTISVKSPTQGVLLFKGYTPSEYRALVTLQGEPGTLLLKGYTPLATRVGTAVKATVLSTLKLKGNVVNAYAYDWSAVSENTDTWSAVAAATDSWSTIAKNTDTWTKIR